MRKIEDILRRHFELGLGVRQIARSLSISHSTAGDLLRRAKARGHRLARSARAIRHRLRSCFVLGKISCSG